MLVERNKRCLIVDVQPDTIMDLLNQLPKRLLTDIVSTYNLPVIDDSKSAAILSIAEHRRQVFKTIKFQFSYTHHDNQTS
jgi:hypothetical protein